MVLCTKHCTWYTVYWSLLCNYVIVIIELVFQQNRYRLLEFSTKVVTCYVLLGFKTEPEFLAWTQMGQES